MNDKTNVRDLNPVFERLLDALEMGLDLASRADRDNRLAEIGEHLALAMRLTTDALAGRGYRLDFWPAGSNLDHIWPALRARLGTGGRIRHGTPR